MIAVGVREPNYPIQLMFIGTVKLKHVAIFMLLLDLLFMTSGNAGGHIAHLGGALAGWWFAAGLQKGMMLPNGLIMYSISLRAAGGLLLANRK